MCLASRVFLHLSDVYHHLHACESSFAEVRCCLVEYKPLHCMSEAIQIVQTIEYGVLSQINHWHSNGQATVSVGGSLNIVMGMCSDIVEGIKAYMPPSVLP